MIVSVAKALGFVLLISLLAVSPSFLAILGSNAYSPHCCYSTLS